MENYLTQITNYLLTQSWQIAVLVVVIAAVNLALKNKSAHVRYLLWLIVLAKCLVPPLLTVPLTVLPQEKAAGPISVSPVQVTAVPIEAVDTTVTETPTPPVSPVVAVTTPAVTEKPARLTTHQWLALVWVIGATVFVLVAVTKALRTSFWLWRQRKLLPAEAQTGIENLFSGFDIKTFPKVWLLSGIGQPFVWGLLRGSIYLPADFVKVNSAEHRRGVLGHELGHILRFDAAVNILQIIGQAIFWFHPFVWWANKKIRGEREKCCDEMAIARLGAKAKDYSAAIVDTLVAEYKSTRPVPSLAIAGPVRNIEDRVKTIMKPGKKFYKRPSLMAVTVVLLLAFLVVPTVLVLTARAGTEAEQAGRVAEGTLVRDADISELSESKNKVTCIGKVFNAQGEPIAGAKVIAYEMRSDGIAGNMLLRQTGDVTTAEDGAFILTKPKLEKGIYIDCYIVAIKQNLALGWAEWDLRKDLESNIQLGEPTRLEGVIVDKAGKPVAGAEVRTNLYRTIETTDDEEKREWLPGIPPFRELIKQTNRQGRFLFSNLPADLEVDLLVKAEGKATIFTYQSEKSEPAFKAGQTDIRVTLPDEARIEGQIVDPDTGRGIPGVKFAVVFTGSGVFFYRFVCTTDDNGQFSIGGLQNSEYVIRGHRRNSLLPTYVNAKSGQTQKVTVGANKLYYGRILFEDGSPVVIKPEPWAGAKTRIQVEGKGAIRNIIVDDLDDKGYFEIYLSQEQYQQLRSGNAWFEVTVPYTDRKAYLGEDVFAYDLLATDKAKAGVAWIARPMSEPGTAVGKLLFELKAFNINLSKTSTKDRIILACFFDMQQRPSRYFLRELARRAQQLKQKGVTVVAIQASKIDENALNKWVKNDNIPFAVGMVRGDAEKTKFAWGVRALPWLVLTNRNHVISAEGFGLSELYEKIEAVAEK